MSLSTVVTQGYEIGSQGLVVTMGYGQGAAAPTPPVQVQSVYGPALTPYERWFWYDRFVDTESPVSREKKKKKDELRRRIEAGVIKELVVPVEIKAEVKEVVRETVEAYTPTTGSRQFDERHIIEYVARQVAEELALDFKAERLEARRIAEIEQARKLEQEEEDEAMEVLSLWMLQ